MLKKEVKTAKNQELIEFLILSAFSESVSKSTEKIGGLVCNELKNRGIIENPEKLFNIWLG